MPQISQRREQRLEPSLHFSQELIQALQVLQMPVCELGEWLKNQIEQNPLLEYLPQKGKAAKSYSEEVDLQAPLNLFAHLMNQAREVFLSQSELEVAQQIIGNLDERGLFVESLDASLLPILETIQTFDPPGVGARSLQESLLIQLGARGKKNSLAYKLIEKHFDALLHNRLPLIQKKTGRSLEEIQAALKGVIRKLSLNPVARFQPSFAQPLVPDLIVEKRGSKWVIEMNEEPLPRFRLSELAQSRESGFVRPYLSAAHWLSKMMRQRRLTLKRVATFLIKRQRRFFEDERERLIPLTLAEVADALGLHLSTVARATASKQLLCPHGLFALRHFFSASMQGEEVSNKAAKQLLMRLVQEEDKSAPLLDGELCKRLNEQKIPCARRTIAKYRKELKIPTASQRRFWK